MCIVGWPAWTCLAAAGPFENLAVGTADGPDGPTNVQVMADFEDGILRGKASPAPDGFHFMAYPAGSSELSVVDGGPAGSTKCLKVRQLKVYSGRAAATFANFYYLGPAAGFISEARRANTHSFWVRGFDALKGTRMGNFDIGGFNRQRSPMWKKRGRKESHNMHMYWDMKIDWGGSPGKWRRVEIQGNPTHQRSNKYLGGYEPFLDHAEIWPEQTRLYYNFLAGRAKLMPDKAAYMDGFTWYYRNPKLAAFPQVLTRRGTPGEPIVQPVVVWNTHATKTRSFLVAIDGWRSTGGVDWWPGYGSSGAALTDAAGKPVTRTGPLRPGRGMVFYVRYKLPERTRGGEPLPAGGRGVLMLSIWQDPKEVPDPQPYLVVNPYLKKIRTRWDMPGIGLVLTTVATAKPAPPAEPPPVAKLRVAAVGGSWAELAWASPAKARFADEAANDPAAAVYAVRYSRKPIKSEADWNAAVPVESVPPVLGGGIAQQYSLRGLSLATTYHAAVRSYNESGAGSALSSVTFTTKPADPPVRPPRPGGAAKDGGV